MKAYIFLADGFEEVEALTTADILIRAGVEVKLVKVTLMGSDPLRESDPIDSSRGSDPNDAFVCGSHSIRVKADLALGVNVTADELTDGDCVILPGGMPGTKNLAASADVVRLIKAYNEAGKVVAAICAAPSVLGLNGLLNGKKATCFPGNEEKLIGATLVNTGAVIDGNIVTGKSMGSAVTFGLAVTERLLGKEAADKVEASIYRG
ncbi:MAG: DJ-1/PfpI family protein [Lachnospiraceae bacterium]|nr:DJ-1/PfpI family protein [Lachnospiraceae bacterium]